MRYYLDSSIERYKKHLVAQSFSQMYGIDYTKIFASIIKWELLKIFLIIAIILEIIVLQINIIGTYLESFLG